MTATFVVKSALILGTVYRHKCMIDKTVYSPGNKINDLTKVVPVFLLRDCWIGCWWVDLNRKYSYYFEILFEGMHTHYDSVSHG